MITFTQESDIHLVSSLDAPTEPGGGGKGRGRLEQPGKAGQLIYFAIRKSKFSGHPVLNTLFSRIILLQKNSKVIKKSCNTYACFVIQALLSDKTVQS